MVQSVNMWYLYEKQNLDGAGLSYGVGLEKEGVLGRGNSAIVWKVRFWVDTAFLVETKSIEEKLVMQGTTGIPAGEVERGEP